MYSTSSISVNAHKRCQVHISMSYLLQQMGFIISSLVSSLDIVYTEKAAPLSYYYLLEVYHLDLHIVW